jgi:ubiquitin-like-conjugating enzyme ATG3
VDLVSGILVRGGSNSCYLRTREAGDSSKAKDYLPGDKQYLVTRGVPCLRRATSLAYTDADEDAERLLSFGDSTNSTGADEWVETHAGRKATIDSTNPGSIDDIPDLDGAPEDSVTHAVGALSLDGTAETPDLDDIPDMEEEGLEEEEDEATAAPKAGVVDARLDLYHPFPDTCLINYSSQVEVANGNLLQVRTYDVMITYDKYYQTPRIWLIGYDEVGFPGLQFCFSLTCSRRIVHL